MLDNTRRKTLKAIGVASTAAILPAWAIKASAVEELATDSIQGLNVAFSRSYSAGAELVTLSNTTQRTINLRHIYPGIVSSGKRTYDLNGLFSNGEISIAPGGSQVFSLNSLSSKAKEQTLPRGLTHSRPMKVSTIERSFNVSTPVSTTRSFFV